MNAITLAGLTIHQDTQGRYSLNDLFRASGGANHHRPSLWLRSQRTKDVIEALFSEHEFVPRTDGEQVHDQVQDQIQKYTKRTFESLPSEEIQGSKMVPEPIAQVATGAPGTYVVKELVYSYAMWISPAFHLLVVRAYDSLVTGRITEVNAHLTQTEKYWFARRPAWPEIRQRVLAGQRYRDVAAALARSVGSVVRSVRRMIEVGLLDPVRLISAQHGPARLAARRLAVGWGLMTEPEQLPLALE